MINYKKIIFITLIGIAFLKLAVAAQQVGQAQAQTQDQSQQQAAPEQLPPPQWPVTQTPSTKTPSQRPPQSQPQARTLPPAFSAPLFLPQNVDWAGIGKLPLDQRPAWFDPMNYMPISADGSVWDSVSLQERERVEDWSGYYFGARNQPKSDDTYLLSRLLLANDLQLGDNVRIFVEGKSSLSTDRDLLGLRRTQDADNWDTQDAFVDILAPFATEGRNVLRAGRQEMNYGAQRLVAVSDWSNTRRTFDGLKDIVNSGLWTISMFDVRPVLIRQQMLDISDPNTDFLGAYATGPVPSLKINLDLYYFKLERQNVTFNGTTGFENRDTFGTRVVSQLPGRSYDYELEAAYQGGSLYGSPTKNNPIDATMFYTLVGYTFRDFPSQPRLYAQYQYASGSTVPGGIVGTFNQLFPSRRGYLGFADVIGRQNIIDESIGVKLDATRKLNVTFERHAFWRASAVDALYDPAGAIVRTATSGTSRDVGTEFDLTLHYILNPHTNLDFGLTHFSAGTFIQQAPPAENVNFAYMATQLTF